MKKVKNMSKNAIIILIITIVVMYILLKDDFVGIVKILNNLDLKYILIAILLFMLSLFLKAYVSYLSVNEKKKYTILDAYKHTMIVQFFNGITPFSTGGQPMEIYMLSKHDISGSKSTSIILQNFIFYQIALVLFGICAVVFNAIYGIFPKVHLLKELIFIGFIINTLVAIIIVFISISNCFTKVCSDIIIYLLNKMRIVKDKEKAIKKWDKRLTEFHDSARIVRDNKKLFIIGVGLNIVSLACLYITPLFIAFSMRDYESLNVLTTLTSSAYVLIIGAFVPIPGASGGIEYGFLSFFGNFFKRRMTNAILLVWRFITYYMPMILGAIVLFHHEKED